jgi:excisionase family DNA binding protein
VILREFEGGLVSLARGLSASPDPNLRDVASEIFECVDSLRESVRQWKARDGDDASELGRSEVPSSVDRAASGHVVESSLMAGRLTTGQVAERLGVGVRRVVQMIDVGKLSATKVGGRQWIEEASVIEEEKRRRGHLS